MKKLFLISTICLSAFFACAQQSKEAADFNRFSATSDSTAHVAYKLQDYNKAIAIEEAWVNRYNSLPVAMQHDFMGYKAGINYNRACYYAMAGQKANAIATLKISVDAGFEDYANANVDSDLLSLHDDAEFKALLTRMREKGDYPYILQQAGPYDQDQNSNLPVFTYQAAETPELVNFKHQFNLDSIAGNGDEISRIKNLLFWAHNVVRHDGNSNNPPNKNAIDLIAVCKKDDRGVNCRMMATILKDAYQAEGFKARMVTCMPKDTADFDCHVINVVWSKTYNKWIWMDPTFDAYLRDDKGNYLSIEEVRALLIKGTPPVLNDDANWNHTMKETKEAYFNYMSKNLYWIKCAVKSDWDLETVKQDMAPVNYVNLYPGGFSTIGEAKKVTKSQVQYATNNPEYFWQKPVGE